MFLEADSGVCLGTGVPVDGQGREIELWSGPEDMTADKGAPSPSTTEARTDRLGGGSTDLNTGTSLKVFCDGQRAEGLRDVKTYEGVLCRQHDSGKTYFVFLFSEFTCWEEWICRDGSCLGMGIPTGGKGSTITLLTPTYEGTHLAAVDGLTKTLLSTPTAKSGAEFGADKGAGDTSSPHTVLGEQGYDGSKPGIRFVNPFARVKASLSSPDSEPVSPTAVV